MRKVALGGRQSEVLVEHTSLGKSLAEVSMGTVNALAVLTGKVLGYCFGASPSKSGIFVCRCLKNKSVTSVAYPASHFLFSVLCTK